MRMCGPEEEGKELLSGPDPHSEERKLSAEENRFEEEIDRWGERERDQEDKRKRLRRC